MSRDKITGVGVISIATHTHTRRLSFCLFLSFFQQQTCSKTVKVGHVVDPPVNWGPRSIQYIYNIQYISFFLSSVAFIPALPLPCFCRSLSTYPVPLHLFRRRRIALVYNPHGIYIIYNISSTTSAGSAANDRSAVLMAKNPTSKVNVCTYLPLKKRTIA